MIYLEVIAGAGNETTNRLIGWTTKVLAEHPDQRRQVAADPLLIPNTIPKLLRFEPQAHHIAHVVNKDIEVHGRTLTPGDIVIFVIRSGQPR